MTSRPRTRLDPDIRRQQILDTASNTFGTTPFSEVSLDDIADAAGVTRGLLHHYFGSKRNLYLEVVEQAVRIPPTTELIPAGTTGDFDDVVGVCVSSWMRMIEASGGLWSGAATNRFSDADVDAIVTAARDDLVERMLRELPFPPALDADLLRCALRSFAALAREASADWLVTGRLSRPQTEALLWESLLTVVHDVVPAMMTAGADR